MRMNENVIGEIVQQVGFNEGMQREEYSVPLGVATSQYSVSRPP